VTNQSHQNHKQSLELLAEKIHQWGQEQGFQQIAITDTDLTGERERLDAWLDSGYHGDMTWIEERKAMRLDPQQLLPGTQRVIIARINYLPEDTQPIKVLKSPDKAYISRYSLGRDYHKLVRKRLAIIAENLRREAEKLLDTGDIQQRPFVDSAPVLERPLAEKAGLGWVGKNTLVIHPEAGSWFFLGEIFTNLPLPLSSASVANRCGDCTACLKVCPTDAFTQPYELDARRCISYLTIENKGAIPVEFREAIGNRIYGCDDCQSICPWNKYATPTEEGDFQPRHGLHDSDLLALFNWDEKTFLKHTEGSAIRRIGYQSWLRNLAVALGNSPHSQSTIDALEKKRPEASAMVAEHIDWALAQQRITNRRRQRKIKNPNKAGTFDKIFKPEKNDR